MEDNSIKIELKDVINEAQLSKVVSAIVASYTKKFTAYEERIKQLENRVKVLEETSEGFLVRTADGVEVFKIQN